MLPIPNLRRETRPTDLRKTTHDALKAALLAPALYLKEHPDITTHFALPFAGATLSGPLLSLLPLGPLGPLLGILAASFARFKLRQNAAGSYYALLHSAGLAGVSGQVLSLMSFMSLGAVFGSKGAAAQSWFTSLVLSTGGLRAPIVGLALSLLTSFTGYFGILPSFIGGSGAAILFKEVQSFAIFRGLGWGLKEAEKFWRQFLNSTWYECTGDEEDKGSWKWKMLRSTIQKISALASNIRRSDQAKEALNEWEMISDSGEEQSTAADPKIPGTFPVTSSSDDVRAWLADVRWDGATPHELDDCNWKDSNQASERLGHRYECLGDTCG